MSATIWLRVSAVISLLFSVGHFMGGRRNWSPMKDNPVLEAMRTVRFNVMGVDRSYLDFYLGFGHTLTVSLLCQSLLLWMLGDVARKDAALARPMIAVFLVSAAVSGVISWEYILPIPTFCSLVLCATLIVALIAARRRPGAARPGPSGSHESP